MKIKILITAVTVFSSLLSFSQENTSEVRRGFKYGNSYDLAFAAGTDQLSGALSWLHFHGIGKKKKFKAGYGIRFTSYHGRNQNYLTAPAILTNKQTGPQVLFSETFPENIDTFFVSKAQSNSLNIFINFQYSFTSKFEIGFNICALGFSFGANQSGKFISSIRPVNITEVQDASPTSFNFLLIDDNDIGMLNSEMYGLYWLSAKIGIKAGLSLLHTEYTTSNKLTFANDRFRNESWMGMAGIIYTPFK